MKRVLMSALVFVVVNALGDENLQLPEENFERLFTYPQSRAFLDANRHKSAEQLAYTNLLPGESKAAVGRPQSRQLSVNGFILSDSGRHTVWLDEGLGPESTVSRNYKPNLRSKKVPVSAAAGTRLLKPGQVWLLGENKVEEKFNLKTNSEALITDSDVDDEQLEAANEESSETENDSNE